MFNQLILTKSYIRFLNSGDGGIGRRTGLKILGTLVREGSSPSLRISHFTRNDTNLIYMQTHMVGQRALAVLKLSSRITRQFKLTFKSAKTNWFWHLD